VTERDSVQPWMKAAARAILHAGSWPDEWEPEDAEEIAGIIAVHAEEIMRQRDEFKEAAYRLENTIRLLRTEAAEHAKDQSPGPASVIEAVQQVHHWHAKEQSAPEYGSIPEETAGYSLEEWEAWKFGFKCGQDWEKAKWNKAEAAQSTPFREIQKGSK
jgi:hypothetical protein